MVNLDVTPAHITQGEKCRAQLEYTPQKQHELTPP
jgi:hypothetical protein